MIKTVDDRNLLKKGDFRLLAPLFKGGWGDSDLKRS